MRLFATIALLALALTGPALAETNVGVTAAVNQDAKGVVGSNVKTISLGDSVVFNQRIQTGAGGLVQVLLADGTTFMVGPNSDLVIDSFVYDPNAGTAQVTASFTKGVLRFIGGQTSKTEGGVTINTPVGTMGIRGAMVDIVLNPPSGTPPHVDMLFGNEVTLEKGKDLLGRLYAAGYSLALGEGGVFEVLKTPPGWGSQIQAALAGKLGTKGGAPKGPTDGDVKNSDVAENNSGKGPDKPPLSKEELDALLYAAAHYDELRNFIVNNQHLEGYIGGMFTGPENCEYYECYTPNAPGVNDYDTDEGDYIPTHAKVAFDANGNPVFIEAAFLAAIYCECDENGDDVSFVYDGDGTAGHLTVQFVGDEEPTVIDTAFNDLYAYDDPREDNPMNQPTYLGSETTYADQLDCVSCDEFIRWGFWGFTAEDVPEANLQGNIDFMGTWVAGNLTTTAQMQNLAELDEGNFEAHYNGDAVGVVVSQVDDDTERYIATGELAMTYNFGQREGIVDITNFDTEHLNAGYGVNIHYDVNGSADGTNGFLGFTEGEGYNGLAQGAFANNGSDVAAGVLGNWTYNQYGDGYDYSVGGVFVGDTLTGSPH
jgi:hypothetical protein